MIRTPTPERAQAPDIAWAASLDRARDTVPFYRDAWARDGRLDGASAVLPEESLSGLHFLLWPLGSEIGDQWSHAATVDRRTLTGALTAGGQLRHDDVIFEIRDAVVDWSLLGGHDYRVLLPQPALATLSPRLRHRLDEHRDTLLRCRGGVLIAGPDQLQAVLTAMELPPTVRTIARIDWDRIGRQPAGGEAVLHAEHIGYLGAWSVTCGHWHLAPGVHARVGADGCELSDLLHREPTLLRYRPRHQPRLLPTVCGSGLALEVDDA